MITPVRQTTPLNGESADRPRRRLRQQIALTAAFLMSFAILMLFWIPSMGRSLACDEQPRASDAILVDNFDPSYLVFEHAGDLQRAGMASKILVPTTAGSGAGGLNRVAAGFVEVLAREARLPAPPKLIPIVEVEPISLNAAYQIRAVLEKEGTRSVIIVAPGFRSRRSLLVYSTVFGAAGIRTSCVPVFSKSTPDNWMDTWHGIQEVVEQYGKLQYYRLWILARL